MKHSRTPTLLALLLASLLTCNLAHAALTPNAAGDEITDSKTGLIWKRCAEGMAWSSASSTCTGTATTYTLEQALAHAKTLAGAGWRLPNVKELSSIVDDSRVRPAINTLAFPETPFNWFWSASPNAGDSSNAWNVNFSSGSVLNNNRSNSSRVRLVR
jgi:hypothetical protein